MKKGFTLIELLVVVLIIGILSAVALPQYQKVVLKSRIPALMPIVKSIVDAEEIYYLANGKYTANIEDLDVSLPGYTYVRGGSSTSWSEYEFGSDKKAKIALNADSNSDVYVSYPVPGANGASHTVELRLGFLNRTNLPSLSGKWYCRDQGIAAMTTVCKSLGFTQRGPRSDLMIQP